MLNSHFRPLAPAAITVAACGEIKDSYAMLRWIQPVLDEWPRQAWSLWLVDARHCDRVRAAKMGLPAQRAEWVDIDTEEFDANGAVCGVISGQTGLVVYAPEAISQQVLRALEGLAVGLVSFAVNDPLAKPFKRSFASFGVIAGI